MPATGVPRMHLARAGARVYRPPRWGVAASSGRAAAGRAPSLSWPGDGEESMRPRPIPVLIVLTTLSLAIIAPHTEAMAGAPALPLTFRHPPSLPRLDALSPVRPLDPLPEGRWRNFGLLQNDNHAAFYDPAQDRLICIGGGRDGSWELPLTGTMTWRELANSPYQPWPVGWWATSTTPPPRASTSRP